MLSRLLAATSGGLLFVGGQATTLDTTATPTATFSLSGGVDTAPQAGDIVIACVAFRDGTNRNIQCTTAGYTEIADLFRDECQLGIYYKVLSAQETEVSFDLGVSRVPRFAAHVWRRADQANPLDATTTTTTTFGGGRPDAPPIETQTPNAVVIAIGAGAYRFPGSSAYTVPPGMIHFFTTGFSTDSRIGIASLAIASPTVYDPPAFGGGNSFGLGTASASVALRHE